MNIEESKEIMILKEEILGIKEEVIKLNSLVSDLVRELKISLCTKKEIESSEEIDDILKTCLDNF